MERPPEPRLLRKPRWRWHATGNVEFWDERHARWQGMGGWTGDVLAALETGTPYADMVALVERKAIGRTPEQKLREFLYTLSRFGYVDIPYDAPPALYAGRYERVRELGRGGVGIADLCRDLEDGGDFVVVKRAWDYLQPFEVTERSMRHEAEVMARLDHPGVARMKGAFEREGHLHLVRDFVDGDDLLRYQHKGLDGDAFRELAARVADVVRHLHERGYLLLDLRPANWLVAGDGRVVLMDVGQCKALVDGKVDLPRPVGSQGFMSPEVREARRADVRSDVWGLGRLFLFLATGKLPYAFASREDVVAALEGHVARDLVLAMTEDDPAARPADVGEVLARLRA